MSRLKLEFNAGTLLLREEPGAGILPGVFGSLAVQDDRTGDAWRAAAYQYAPVLRLAKQHGIEVDDRARDYTPLDLKLYSPFAPMEHQRQAMERWRASQARGTVVMPTGSGKTYFAVRCIAAVNRPAIVVAPTIDLMVQWAEVLKKFFRQDLFGTSAEHADLLPEKLF